MLRLRWSLSGESDVHQPGQRVIENLGRNMLEYAGTYPQDDNTAMGEE